MPISRITKIGGTQGTKLASGTTAQRGSVEGEWRYNSETGFFEGRNDTKFLTLEPTPTVASVDDTEVDSAGGGNQTIVVTGTNFTSGGTITFVGNAGANFDASTTTFNSATQVTAVAPKASFLNAQEPYKVRFTTSSGLAGTSASGLINVDNAPAFTTAAGSLGTIDHTQLAGGYSLTALAASDAEGDTVAYSQPSGSLPAGLSLNTSNGSWSGTVTGIVSTTTFSFTGRATAGSKTSDRSFSIVQEGELNNTGTQYAFSFNGDTDNAGSNTDTYVSAGSINVNSTGQTKYNAKSAHFPNSGYSSFKIPASTDLQFGSGNFTIEGWLYLVNDSSNVNLSARVFQMGENNANGIALIHNYSGEFLFGNTHSQVVGENSSNWLGAWRYFTVSRDGSNIRLFRDGVQQSIATSGFNDVTHSADLYFGVYPGSLTGIRSNMYLSEWQITKGVGKYTSNFTPPSGAFLT